MFEIATSRGKLQIRIYERAIKETTDSRNGPVYRHMVKAMDVAKRAMIDEAPVGKPDPLGRERKYPPGNLRDRIVKRIEHTSRGWKGTVGPEGVPYVMYVVEGTPPHTIVPVRARRLVFAYQPGEPIFARRVRHPGTKPNPFPTRAMIRVFGSSRVRELR